MIELKLPDLGEGVSQADVSQILVQEGATVEKDQPVLELENEKATFELPCETAGTVSKVLVKVGQTLKVGQPFMIVAECSGSAPTAAPKPAAPGSTAAAPAKPTAAPTNGGSTMVQPPQNQPIAAPAPSPRVDSTAVAALPARENGSSSPPPPAGPATRRMARELGVDLQQVRGTGPAGRISQEDVQAFVRLALAGGAAANRQQTAAATPLPDFSQWGPVRRQPMNKIARTSADHLSHAWATIPHVTQHELVDVTELETGRKRFVQARPDVKLTMTVLAMKAVVTALRQFPNFNSSLDAASGELILKDYYHIGIAVDTEHGLLVPVIRDVDKKTCVELAQELVAISDRARARKLSLDEMRGGTFTITNLGGIGGTSFTPIVNPPEVAILGLSRTRWQPVVVDGGFESRLMLPLSLSYDHRVINGADGARFISRLALLLGDLFELLSAT